MIRGVHHIAVQVTDLVRAEAFWSGLLGLPVVRRFDDDAGAPRSIWVDAGAAFVALEKVPPGAPLPFVDPTPGAYLIALAIEVGARASWEARLAAAGVTIEKRSAYTIYFRDPDGTRLGLSHYPDAS